LEEREEEEMADLARIFEGDESHDARLFEDERLRAFQRATIIQEYIHR
jgi:hypothetical protein